MIATLTPQDKFDAWKLDAVAAAIAGRFALSSEGVSDSIEEAASFYRDQHDHGRLTAEGPQNWDDTAQDMPGWCTRYTLSLTDAEFTQATALARDYAAQWLA